MKISVSGRKEEQSRGAEFSLSKWGVKKHSFKNHGLRVVSKKWSKVNYLYIIESFKVTTRRLKNNYLRRKRVD